MSRVAMLKAMMFAGACTPRVSGQMQLGGAFEIYPGYTGDLSAVAGSVTLGQDGENTQVMFFNLEKVDPQCTSSADVSGVANACGVHVHSGTSCANASGHYWSSSFTSNDPWATVRYTVADSGNTAVAQNVQVATGLTLADIDGRAFVVHDAAGKRIACSLLSSVPLTSASQMTVESFSKYPGYTGSLAVAGKVLVDESGAGADASQVLTFNLTGVDPTCGTANIDGVANACGIHVHAGKDCTNASTIGGHYYDDATIAVDPWKPIMYTTSGGSTTGVTVKIGTGMTNSLMKGRSVVVHDATGARIACGLLPDGHNSVIDGAYSKTLALPIVFVLLAALLH